MIDPLSPHAQVPTPGRTRPLLLRPLALAAALVLAACSSQSGARNDPNADPADEADAVEVPAVAPTMQDAYRCLEEFDMWPTECTALGVTPEESMAPQDTESEARDGLTYLWPSGIRSTVEIVEYSSDVSCCASAGVEAATDDDRVLIVRLTVANESDVPFTFGNAFGGGEDPNALVPDLALYMGQNKEDAQSWAHGEGYPEQLSPGTSEYNDYQFSLESANTPLELRVSLTTQDILAHMCKNRRPWL
jgi:hypothetical protein